MKREHITAVILAGGQARRLGGVDKGLVPVANQRLIEFAASALEPQAGSILVSANRNAGQYMAMGFEVIADPWPDYRGPMAGVLAALRAARSRYVLTAPCDAPLIASDLAERLEAAMSTGATAAVAHDGARLQPLFALLDRALADPLQHWLEGGGRSAGAWMEQCGATTVDFSDRPQMFLNLNRPEELRAFEDDLPVGQS